MTDYGRLTAKDRREIRRAVERLSHNAGWTRGVGNWLPIIMSTWEHWTWVVNDPSSTYDESADILESLLMTDRMFR